MTIFLERESEFLERERVNVTGVTDYGEEEDQSLVLEM